MTDNVITTSDTAPRKVPASFTDLKKAELVAAAEYFGSETEGNAEVVRSDLIATGVTFEQYLSVFYPAEQPTDAAAETTEDGGEDMTEQNIVTAPPAPEFSNQDKFLIKFIGQNPYFEFGDYKFSTDKPYGIMPAADAQRALVQEPTKFRQAFPDELQEFYS